MMNKNMIHIITLPTLLASAVSLHILSYTLEEPQEIIAVTPIEIERPVKLKEKKEDKLPSEDSKSKNLPESAKKEDSAGSDKKEEAKENQVKNEESDKKIDLENGSKDKGDKKPKTQKDLEEIVKKKLSQQNPRLPLKEKNEVSPKVLEFLPSKVEQEIINEARISGGRVDPFLSIMPPEVPKVPSLSDEEKMFLFPKLASKSTTKSEKGKYSGDDQGIPNPPDILNPDYKESPEKKDSAVKSEKPRNPEDSIQFEPSVSIGKGVSLNGIITGAKPLALLNVDGENKVIAVGDFIRKDKNIKLVSINFESQSVMLSDSQNRRARVEIKE